MGEASSWPFPILFLPAILILFVGCARQGGKGITLAGSTSVEPFAERLAELYVRQHKGAVINVQGGGSSAGVQAVTNGICDIGMSSRALTADEKGLNVIPIALDGIVIIVNRQNPVADLTVEQARGIFGGDIRDWSQVGGPKQRITVITREEGSGTRASFEQKVMSDGGGQSRAFAGDALVQDSNGAVREIVASDRSAIGYISFGLVDERVRALALNNVAPAESTIYSGRYPVTRQFLFLTGSENDTSAQAFIRYVLSPAGQQVLSDEGLVKVVTSESK